MDTEVESTSPPLPSSSSSSYSFEIKNNEERCRRILECKQQILSWQDKLRTLEKQQEKYIKLSRLRLDAPLTWRLLSRRERREKDFILAALKSPELPDSLENFESGSFPSHIRSDRDILLARARRNDFAKKTNNGNDRNDKDEIFFIPPKLRGDKGLILEIVRHYPRVIEFMSDGLKGDRDVLRAFLKRTKLPAHFLQHFSGTLRSDARLMLEVQKHPDNGLSSMTFCSTALRDDKSFFLQAVAGGDHDEEKQVLRFASQRLRDDFEVVMRCVRRSGMNLKHASYDLRRDQQIVSAAAAQDPASFRYCLPGILKQSLLEQKEFASRIVPHAPLSVVKHCLEMHECDEKVVLMALRNPSVEWCMIPCHLRAKSVFVAKAVRASGGKIWEDLPMETKCDLEVASALMACPSISEGAAVAAFAVCPELFANRDAMMHFIANHGKGDLLPIILESSPMEIKRDKELMMEAVASDVTIWEHCPEELREDRDIALAAVKGSPHALFFVGDSYQLENPDIVVLTIAQHAKNLQFVYHDVCKELWHNRDVALAWLTNGGDWLDDAFPEEFGKDEELVLTLVRRNWSDFEMTSEDLRGNKEFILKAVAVDARIVRDVDDEILYDEDVALAAISEDARSLQFFSGGRHFEFIVSFAKLVRGRLREYQCFQEDIVASMGGRNDECSRQSPKFSVLSMLNQGPATLAMYKGMIASYVGVLYNGDEIRKYAAASRHLAEWGL